jgi:alkyl sulfatase BDS1-like metallo-beta-lactamase superfamily hydrolase
MRLDPAAALRQARRALAQAEGGALSRAAQLVATVPPERLDHVMTTPFGRAVIEGIFWQMPLRLDRTRAAGTTACIRWRITTASNGSMLIYNLTLTEGSASVIRGRGGPDPRLTITVDAAEFLRLATGNSNPMQAYFSGKLSLTGDLLLAARMTALFRIPRTTPRRRPPGASAA